MSRAQNGQMQGQGRPRLLFVPRQFERGQQNGNVGAPHRPTVAKNMVPVRPLSRHYTRGYLGSDLDDDFDSRSYLANNRDVSYAKKMSGRVYYNGEWWTAVLLWAAFC